MDYIITEKKLANMVGNYITQIVGELSLKDSDHQHATEGDFQLVDKNDNTIFEFLGNHLGVSQLLFSSIMDLFSRNVPQTEKLFEAWFKKNFPDERLVAAYHSIYY